MKFHFIAIGGAAMHSIAISLHQQGHQVSGSDDSIQEPSLSRLRKAGILPDEIGWLAKKIEANMDAVILGMHARADNPELLKAQELGLKIYSFPDFLYEQTKNKKRVVIGGSHGKTTITGMIMHVLKHNNYKFDYLVGAGIQGFDNTANLHTDNTFAIFEGDEYLASPLDLVPKFLKYKANIALLSGIAWDHINVFPSFDIYKEQFLLFTKSMETGGKLIWCGEDHELQSLSMSFPSQIDHETYYTHPSNYGDNGSLYLDTEAEQIPIAVFGTHNLQNISGAKAICGELGLSDKQFYDGISTYNGAGRRLETFAKNDSCQIYRDFAHSPSKLKATVNAVLEQHPVQRLIACFELHTFSSLTKEFLPEYHLSLDDASYGVVYFSQETLKHKNLPMLDIHEVKDYFASHNLLVFDELENLKSFLYSLTFDNLVLLMMSSGNFSGLDINALATAKMQ